MVAAGVLIFDVGQVLGHLMIQVTMRYSHLQPSAGRPAIDALERRRRARPSGGGWRGGVRFAVRDASAA